ncbi:MAG: glycoside hydrolase family 38 C-terminal domain-containing protein [Bacteroidota bacterium]|nr:glycoside hydrolase family 38 C-terminal domain-containing protein [Bacteroidota bacterium]
MKHFFLLLLSFFCCIFLSAQQSYFIDGYHGGIYGHLPAWQTRFMVDKLNAYPDWKINLELEPESWDSIAISDKSAYEEFVKMFADQSPGGRIEYVNPSYGQSYLYNISGESVIRQFFYGMRKLRQHFPGAVFSTYSSEEPCFTSALPQILGSYGFKYASLKNPETCWGGYTRAFGGELLNWIGPDGSILLTVPRYATEALKPGSTWETIACNNSVAYVTRAFQYGIKHPVGMCLQDAGWDLGPERYGHWIRAKGDSARYDPEIMPPHNADYKAADDVETAYAPTEFETWRGYIENKSVRIPDRNWHFSQEDVLVSLVWGGQILQRIAREVRVAENKIITAEKLAAMAKVFRAQPWPGASLDEAWRTLLLSQHHDCWIVPYNPVADRKASHITWADNVASWTGNTVRRSDSIVDRSVALFSSQVTEPSAGRPGTRATVTVFNSTAGDRNESVRISLPAGWKGARAYNDRHQIVPGQPAFAGSGSEKEKGEDWLLKLRAPSMGYAVYTLEKSPEKTPQQPDPGHQKTKDGAASVYRQQNGMYKIETDLYSILIDPAKGGIIKSLVAKHLGHKEFVDAKSGRSFNELRGDFYSEGGFRSVTETPAQVRILEPGPVRVKLEIRGMIAGNPFTQELTVAQGERRIDLHLMIDWKHNTGIGESPDATRDHPMEKAFYNDSFKLQALFPLNLSGQKVYKNAPFDVLESRLSNTFFNSWDSIKNVVLLNWVDVTDASDNYGMALLCDHTTSYAHGSGYPLALTIQYSGQGLFGSDYSINGPTELSYALIPHAWRWDKAGIWMASARWNEPLVARVSVQSNGELNTPSGVKEISSEKSMIRMEGANSEVSSMIFSGSDLLVRLFHAAGNENRQRIYFGFGADAVNLITLNGDMIRSLKIQRDALGKTFVEITMPPFGIRTLQFKKAVKNEQEMTTASKIN